jgi:hypothetical protein
MRKARALSIYAVSAMRQQSQLAGSVVVLTCAAALALAGQAMPL